MPQGACRAGRERQSARAMGAAAMNAAFGLNPTPAPSDPGFPPVAPPPQAPDPDAPSPVSDPPSSARPPAPVGEPPRAHPPASLLH